MPTKHGVVPAPTKFCVMNRIFFYSVAHNSDVVFILIIAFVFLFPDNRDRVMVSGNAEGLTRVEESNGKYAFLMESASIQYIIERNCKLTQIGGDLDNKV